jgi:hypothetical protein
LDRHLPAGCAQLPHGADGYGDNLARSKLSADASAALSSGPVKHALAYNYVDPAAPLELAVDSAGALDLRVLPRR